MLNRGFRLSTLIIGLSLSSAGVSAQDNWELSGSYRLRFENLGQTFRANGDGGDQILVSRLLASVKFQREQVFAELEVMDSRSWFDDRGTPLGTDDVNTLEPLQAYLGWRFSGNGPSVRLGRFTLNLGSRRFVSRNRFRNTINAYTGIHSEWKKGQWHGHAMFAYPNLRRPTSTAALANNDISLDDADQDTRFWVLHVDRVNNTPRQISGYLAVLERENSTVRDLIYTVGFRLLDARESGWGHELEAAYQFGHTRSTNNGSLDIDAGFVHGALRYQYDGPLASRVSLLADYVSGDQNPDDLSNNSFNTLFGSRRFDFGPTGIYGLLARRNVISPAVRWEFKRKKIQGMVSLRAAWLESSKDSLATASLRDITGTTGSFLGEQLQIRIRRPIAKAQLEFGGAYLAKGEFLEDAPGAPLTGNTRYLYGQVTYQF